VSLLQIIIGFLFAGVLNWVYLLRLLILGVGNRVMTSPNGIDWTIRVSAADNGWHSVCWSPELELFCAVSYSGTGNRVMTSPDGINWTIVLLLMIMHGSQFVGLLS